jgi:hypothetical protein
MASRSLTLCIHFSIRIRIKTPMLRFPSIHSRSESVPLEQGLRQCYWYCNNDHNNCRNHSIKTSKMNTQTKTHNGKPPFKHEA